MADKVTLKENAKNNSIFAFFGGISYAAGPLIGGFLANSNWRWCFIINLPVAAVGMALVFLVLRPILLGPQPLPELLGQDNELRGYQKFKAQLSTIDFFGKPRVHYHLLGIAAISNSSWNILLSNYVYPEIICLLEFLVRPALLPFWAWASRSGIDLGWYELSMA
jgi:MFS family permease